MNQNLIKDMKAGLSVIALIGASALTGCGDGASSDDLSLAGSTAIAGTAGSTDLSGTWVFNKELSDHPRRRDHGQRPDRPRGDRPHRPDSARTDREVHEPPTMVIVQTDSTVEISGPRDHKRLLYTDGRVMVPQREDAPEGIEVTAVWNAAGELVVARKGPKGGKRTETFSLSENGAQLTIASVLDPPNDRGTRGFKRVFDAAP